MHIAIDARIINSGTGTYVVNLLEHLQEIDRLNEYSILLQKKDLSYWKPRNKNFKTLIADYDNYSFNEQIGFKRFLENLKPDLVHFCMPQQPIFYTGKCVTTVHDLTLLKTYNSDKNWLIYHSKQLVGRFVFKRIASKSDHIIAVSETTKKEFQNFTGINSDKISVVYEGAEATRVSIKPYTQLPFKRFLLYVGQQPDYKNIRRLIKAHQKLLEKQPELGLVLVGRMNPDTVANKLWTEKKGFKNIHFTGFIEDAERDWLFTEASAYVFPSLMEGFGLPPLEAMAHGTPVVSSNTSCMPEILGDAAEYFDPFDIDDIAEKTLRVLSDSSLRKNLIKRGHQRVAKYSWQRMAKETHAIYTEVFKR